MRATAPRCRRTSVARQETVTDPGGTRTTITSYDARRTRWSVATRSTAGSDHVTEFAYDADRNLVYRKDPNGHVWRATWSNGDLTSITVPTRCHRAGDVQLLRASL